MIWLAASLALGQTLDLDELANCTPRVIAGTPGVAITQQASSTNAQIYGAVALAEGVLLPEDGFPVGFRMSAIYNVNRLPTVAGCRYGPRYGMAAEVGDPTGLAYATGGVYRLQDLDVWGDPNLGDTDPFGSGITV